MPSVSAGEGVRVKVIAGSVAGTVGPISQPATAPTYLDIEVAPGASFVYTLPQDHAAFLYVFEGSVRIGSGSGASAVNSQQLAVLGEGTEIRVEGVTTGAEGNGARAILVAGRPLREPVAKYGPFVMNTREELLQAFQDFQNGKF